jgi:TPR repeat protein
MDVILAEYGYQFIQELDCSVLERGQEQLCLWRAVEAGTCKQVFLRSDSSNNEPVKFSAMNSSPSLLCRSSTISGEDERSYNVFHCSHSFKPLKHLFTHQRALGKVATELNRLDRKSMQVLQSTLVCILYDYHIQSVEAPAHQIQSLQDSLRPENILYDLTPFSLQFRLLHSSSVDESPFISPEMSSGGHTTCVASSSDVWSLGALLLYLSTNKLISIDLAYQSLDAMILATTASVEDDELREVIRHCLKIVPEERISLSALLDKCSNPSIVSPSPSSFSPGSASLCFSFRYSPKLSNENTGPSLGNAASAASVGNSSGSVFFASLKEVEEEIEEVQKEGEVSSHSTSNSSSDGSCDADKGMWRRNENSASVYPMIIPLLDGQGGKAEGWCEDKDDAASVLSMGSLVSVSSVTERRQAHTMPVYPTDISTPSTPRRPRAQAGGSNPSTPSSAVSTPTSYLAHHSTRRLHAAPSSASLPPASPSTATSSSLCSWPLSSNASALPASELNMLYYQASVLSNAQALQQLQSIAGSSPLAALFMMRMHAHGLAGLSKSRSQAQQYTLLAWDYLVQQMHEVRSQARKYALFLYATCLAFNLGPVVSNPKHRPSGQDVITYCEQSAALGYSSAINYLAYCHKTGEYCPKNLPTALVLYQQAAELGHAGAQCQLGSWFESGKAELSLSRDLSRALHYFTLSAQQGHAAAITHLGNLYYLGKGVRRNLSKAANLFRQAERKGYYLACSNLASCYYYGEGVRKDQRKAVYYYKKAALKPPFYAPAQYNLAVCYEFGDGISQDAALSRKYYQLSAEQGNADAQFQLARHFERGSNGFQRDLLMAIEYYQLAAAQHHVDAKCAVLRLLHQQHPPP